MYVAFLPTAAGAAAGEVVISSASLTEPTRIALTGRTTRSDGHVRFDVAVVVVLVCTSDLSGCCSVKHGRRVYVGLADQTFDPILALMLAASLFEVLRRRARAYRR